MILIASLLLLILLLWFTVVNPMPEIKSGKAKQGDSNPERFMSYVNALCALQPPRSVSGPESLLTASELVHAHFTRLGLNTSYQDYTDGERQFRNVIGVLHPEASEFLVVGAHYDVCGPYPGADDNASGIAGLLELAELAKDSYKGKCGIEFVAYCTEEPPYFRSQLMGSFVHAQRWKESGKRLKLAIVLEMIGYYSDEPNSQQYPIGFLGKIYPRTANFIAFVGRINEFGIVRRMKKSYREVVSTPLYSINTPVKFRGIDFSDHSNYWSLGMPAVMVTDTSFFRNPHYHTAGDLPETLDPQRMKDVIDGVYNAILDLG